MKGLLATVITLIGFGAYACPNMAGTYSCKDSDGNEYTSIVSQEVRNGATVYIADGSEMIADGQSHPMTEEKDGVAGAYNARCGAANVLVDISGMVDVGGGQKGQLTMNANISLTATGVHTETTGQVVVGSDSYPVNFSEDCTRQ